MPDGSNIRTPRPPFRLAAIATTSHLVRQGLEPIARKDSALRHARAFIADCQHPADREAAELLVEIDRALGAPS